MHIIHDLNDFSAPWNSSVLTLGVFDGLHRGHQALIKRLQKRSNRGGRARVLVTYHPHPDLVLGKRPPGLGTELFTYEEKLALLQRFHFDAAIFLPFTMELARMTALRYLKEILLGKLKAEHIIIGYDQCFGRGRKGNYAFLKKMAHRYPFAVDRIKAVRWRGRTISTTIIRKLIEEGEIQKANSYLGHTFFMTGTVIRGAQRGRILGFPTANLEIPENKVLPAEGVYTGTAEVGGQRRRAMFNIGRNPTFGQERLSIEAHILDFDRRIYGERLRLYVQDRIRDERKFDGIDALRAQLQLDRRRAEKVKLLID